MRILRAGLDEVDEVAPLFNDYRRFYGQVDDLAGCSRFIRDRIANEESTVFLARGIDGDAVGFTQLYPSFCSVAMTRMIYLYDLFVVPEARRSGVARALMETARGHGIAHGAGRLQLETAADNHPAQTLYEDLGWERDTTFHTYSLPLTTT